jgi:hypothetical protein
MFFSKDYSVFVKGKRFPFTLVKNMDFFKAYALKKGGGRFKLVYQIIGMMGIGADCDRNVFMLK